MTRSTSGRFGMRRFLPVALLAAALTAHAKEAAPLASDPALEARVMAIAGELRCLVCQNETLADSHADLAIDLRAEIRKQLAQGQTPERIVDFMVERYGEFVRYRPAFNATNALLWLGPFALLAGGGVMLAGAVRRQRRAAPIDLDAAEREQVAALLAARPNVRQA